MNNPDFEKWLRTVQRRPLSAEEQLQLEDCLRRDPSLRESWTEEAALTRLLADLPDAPLSSNFTNRVVEGAHRGQPERRPALISLLGLPLFRPALRAMAAAAVILLAVAGYLVHYQHNQTQVATSVADLSRQIEFAASATELSAVQMLQDFDAIYRLSQTRSLADEELLAAFQ